MFNKRFLSICVLRDFIQRRSVKDWRREFLAGLHACPTQHGLIDLTDVHTRRYTKGIQYDIHGRAVLQERHILLTDNLGDNTLVTVTSGHLITHLQLALLGDDDFGHLHDACGQFVSYTDRELSAAVYTCYVADLNLVVVQQVVDEFILLIVCGPRTARQVRIVTKHLNTFLAINLASG